MNNVYASSCLELSIWKELMIFMYHTYTYNDITSTQKSYQKRTSKIYTWTHHTLAKTAH